MNTLHFRWAIKKKMKKQWYEHTQIKLVKLIQSMVLNQWNIHGILWTTSAVLIRKSLSLSSILLSRILQYTNSEQATVGAAPFITENS